MASLERVTGAVEILVLITVKRKDVIIRNEESRLYYANFHNT